MREILFRAKRDKAYCASQEWTYGVPFIDHEGDCIFKTDTTERVVDPETVGQYTGLTDRNGKKIFEGDFILDNPEYNTPKKYSVYMDKKRGGYFPFACGDGCGCCEWEVVSAPSECEVIGNIHDNPELLNQ